MLTKLEANSIGQNDVDSRKRPSYGYRADWGVSLKLAGAVPQRTLVWLAFAVALALTALPVLFLVRKSWLLAQDVHELRLQVEGLQQQVRRLNEASNLHLALDLMPDLQQQQSQQQGRTAQEFEKRDPGLKDSTNEDASSTVQPSQNVLPTSVSRNSSPPDAFIFPYNSSLNQDSSSRFSLRLARAAHHQKTLPDCPRPKGKRAPPIFMHLRGDGDPQFNSATGFVTGWLTMDWCKYPPNKQLIYHDTQVGGITVNQPGFYLLYVQMAFLRFNQAAAFQVFSKDIKNHKATERLLTSCFERSKEPDFNQLVTCSTTIVVCLNNNDRVYIKAKDVTIDMQPGSSFFGLYRLYAPDAKRGNSFCPTST